MRSIAARILLLGPGVAPASEPVASDARRLHDFRLTNPMFAAQ